MKSLHILALILFGSLAGCASTPKLPADYAGRIFTQVQPEQMASCIAQAASVTPSRLGADWLVDAVAAHPPRQYEITRDKVQTVVIISGRSSVGINETDQAVVNCAKGSVRSAP